MNVKDLIVRLLDFASDDDVVIGVGSRRKIPEKLSNISDVLLPFQRSSTGVCMIVPDKHLDVFDNISSNLDAVITWLSNGCDPKEAAKELQLIKTKIVGGHVTNTILDGETFNDRDKLFRAYLDKAHKIQKQIDNLQHMMGKLDQEYAKRNNVLLKGIEND